MAEGSVALRRLGDDSPLLVLEGTPVIGPELFQRWLFLEALQAEVPCFWADLKLLQEHGDLVAIERWMMRVGVCDQWFADVVWDTVACWMNGSAMAAEGNSFFYAPAVRKDFQVPIFHPLLSDPIPSYTAAGMPETIDETISRIRADFEGQLSKYEKFLKSVRGDDRAEVRKHAQWTALAFDGTSFTRIAGQFAGLRQSDRPDKVVSTAVLRFAERIGLTLPHRKRTSGRPRRS